jgi:hypothetical protein
MSEPITLAEFFCTFVEQHCVQNDTEVVLDVTPEECEQLGRHFIEIMVGCALGLDLTRAGKRGILPRQSTPSKDHERSSEE